MVNLLFNVALVAGVIGLWLLTTASLGGLDSLFRKLHRSRLADFDSNLPHEDENNVLNWPLAARIGFSLTAWMRKAQLEEDLMVRLFQAGLPYYSPAHFYSRQVASALLFAVFGLVNATAISLVVDLPVGVVIAIAFAFGLWGSTQPGLEVRSKIERRKRELILDMTYQLPRLVLLIDAYGSVQEAISGYLAVTERRDIPEKERREAEKQAKTLSKGFAMDLGIAINGMGGNLFAELLNRIAGELTRSVRPQEIASHVRKLYPPSVELANFLDIFVAGLESGLPMKERLIELTSQLRFDLRSRQRESAQAANQAVILAAAAELLPIFFVVGAPVLWMAFQMFL